MKRDREPRILAHRGSTVLAPENTPIAFDLALQHKADVLEIDVRLSRDGVVMVTHDQHLDRTTNGSGPVRAMLANEITKLDAGYRFTDLDGRDWRGSGARIESLASLFSRYPDTPINIDIKDRDDKAADAVADTIARHSRESLVNVGSFHASTLARFRQRSPEVSTAACHSEVARLYFSRWISPLRHRHAACTCLQIPTAWYGLQLATQGFVTEAQNNGVHVMFWTINDPQQMQKLFELGVDGIVTDRVDIARSVRSEINQTERNETG